MKKSLLAMAVAAAISPAAFAQTNVTMYGIVDAGVSFDRSGVDGQGTAFRVNSGYLSSSRFGVTGTEDLGGGLKGVFTLELGFQGDTGAFGTAGVVGFGRRAFVGVQSGFGTIALGRDYTPFFWAQLATDNLGYGLYGNLLNSIDMVGTSNQFLRADNAIFYTSPNFGGLTVRGMISAGGGAAAAANTQGESFTDPKERGRMYAIGAEYGAGPLTVAGAYQQTNVLTTSLTDTGTRKDMVIGAKYNFGAFSLGGGWARVDNETNFNAAVDKSDQAWIGGSIALGKGSLLAQYNEIRQDRIGLSEGKAQTLSLAYTYPFSRRTTGYVSYGHMRNNAGSAVALYASDNTVSPTGTVGGVSGRVLGADPKGIAFGVRHSF